MKDNIRGFRNTSVLCRIPNIVLQYLYEYIIIAEMPQFFCDGKQFLII